MWVCKICRKHLKSSQDHSPQRIKVKGYLNIRGMGISNTTKIWCEQSLPYCTNLQQAAAKPHPVTRSVSLTCAGWIAACACLWKLKQKQAADDAYVQGGESEGLAVTGLWHTCIPSPYASWVLVYMRSVAAVPQHRPPSSSYCWRLPPEHLAVWHNVAVVVLPQVRRNLSLSAAADWCVPPALLHMTCNYHTMHVHVQASATVRCASCNIQLKLFTLAVLHQPWTGCLVARIWVL